MGVGLSRRLPLQCLGDGASKDILRWITHAPDGDVVDDYTTLVWLPLCREVAKLQISLPKPRRVSLAKVANSNEPAPERVTPRVTPAFSKRSEVSQEPVVPQEFASEILRPDLYQVQNYGIERNFQLLDREVARRHECSRTRICRLLALVRLAPEVQARVAALTTTTARQPMDRRELEWVAGAVDWGEQRRRFAAITVRPAATGGTPAEHLLR
jgi:hypothetical protein